MRFNHLLLVTSQCCWLAACGAQAGQSGTVDDDVTLNDEDTAMDSLASDSATQPADDELPSDPQAPEDDEASGCNSGGNAGPCIGSSPPASDSDTCGSGDERAPCIPLEELFPPGSVNCDDRDTTCDTESPECPEGRVPEVVVAENDPSAQCYGRCVPITACSCQEDAECGSEPGKYTCLTAEQHCSTFD